MQLLYINLLQKREDGLWPASLQFNAIRGLPPSPVNRHNYHCEYNDYSTNDRNDWK